MRSISREDALRICGYQAVLVEFGNRGLRVTRPFTPDSPFYMSSGPYDFQGVRYFLVHGPGPNGFRSAPVPRPRKPADAGDGGLGGPEEDWPETVPMEEEEKPAQVTVEIRAEDGKKPAPRGILPGAALKLKAVPSRGSGTFSWRSRSKMLKLENPGSRVVTVSVLDGQREAPSGEVLELVFTPHGRPALSPVSHALSIVKVVIMKNDAHAYGYDEYSEVAAKDHNRRHFQFTPESKLDILSIEKGKIGLLDVHYTGTEGGSLYFKSGDSSICECKPRNSGDNPIVLEVRAKAADYKETKIEVRYGEATGPVVAEIRVAVMAPIVYAAKYFRVEDPESPGTKLKVVATTAQFEAALRRNFKSGMAQWKISAGEDSIKSKYDIIRNGALDLEPGTDSEELKQISADCLYDGTRIIHVHSLRWSYFLGADAGPNDTRIKLRDYGRYLDFVGTNSYILEDVSGKSLTVKIKSVDRAKAEFELEAPLGVELKVADRAALLWPLGGLSGNPTLVSDFGGLSTLIGIVAHELGHSNAGLRDIAEIENIMHGIAEGKEGIRGRELPLFYHPEQKESQWARMPGRE